MLRRSLVIASFVIAALALSACGQTNQSTVEPVFTPTSYDVRVLIGEKYINSQIRAAFKDDPLLQNPTLDILPPNRARGTATVNIGILGATLSLRPDIALSFNLVNGRVVVTVESVELSGFTVPTNAIDPQVQQIKKIAEDLINADLQDAMRGTKLKLTAITATEDSLVLDFNE